jgi:hypothetical protein
MSLLDKASLIVTPNGFKASKLYSVVPSDGSGDMTVTRATTATRENSSGLIESVANNVPRLDYLNSSCPSLLVEPQRTNVQTYSEDFSNAIYLQIGTTVTTNAIVAPDGNTTADKLLEDTSTGFHTIDILNPPVVAGSYTVSVFVKAAERTKFQILGFFALTGNVNFDLIAGTATTTAPALNGRIENYGNGWYRCQATFTDLTGVGAQILFNILNNAGSNSYTGTAGSGLYLWGAQLEAGSYSTSYIPTTTASVTRNADVISKTGISSLIGQTEGTMFIDTNINNLSSPVNSSVLCYLRGSSEIYIDITTAGFITALFYDGSTATGVISGSLGFASGRHKFAFAYKNNDFTLYVDGTQFGADTSGLVSGTLTEFSFQYYLNNYVGSQKINSAQIYKTRLSNSELAQLTTI